MKQEEQFSDRLENFKITNSLFIPLAKDKKFKKNYLFSIVDDLEF